MKGRRLWLTGLVGMASFCIAACGTTSGSIWAQSESSASVTSSPVPVESTVAPVPSMSDPGDLVSQWCTAYGNITSVLADAGTSPAKSKIALTVLGRFADLWDSASELEFVSVEEAAANQRAVAKYAAIITLIAEGASPESAEVKAASDELTATTEADHALLQSSAATVLGMCGAPTQPPSASP